MKRFLTLITAAAMAISAFAQQAPVLPCDPAVKTGKLDNGLTYYIRHNALPAGRAEFYLATHAGAIQEGEGQDGLAHFLEHMCFNGLKNLPGKQMLEYLQHIGAEFGRNINASTGVEVTQYMLNNIPVAREGVLDTCLLVMHDYSHFVLNEEKEIDSERGVILEEKRTRNTASWRMWEKSAPYLYGDSKYATCNIIGSEQTLKTFRPEAIKDFYQTWYRPDLQAIIVIGDIDVEQVYGKIVKLFADVPAPVAPKEKVLPEVPINEKPVAGVILDSENTSTSVEFTWKLGKPSPREINGTTLGLVEGLLKDIISDVMNERFSDIVSKPDAPFTNAYLYIGNACENLEIAGGVASCKDAAAALAAEKAFLIEIQKMKRFGFTDDEVNRAKENLLKKLKDRVAAASTRKNPEFVRPIINHFFHGYAYMEPQQELQLTEMILSQLPSAAINQMLTQLIKDDNVVVLYNGIDKEGLEHPSQQQLLDVYTEVKGMEIQANAAEAIEKNFMVGRTLKAGKVKKETAGLYGSSVWTLSNGLRVVACRTEHKKNEVLISLRRPGGLSNVPTSDIASFDDNVMAVFENNCGIAQFPGTVVPKMLAGKTLSISPVLAAKYSGLNGHCAPDDIETAFQIAHLLYADPRFDTEEWNTSVKQLGAVVPNLDANPNVTFSKHIYKNMYSNFERVQVIDEEKLSKANLDTYRKYYQSMFDGVSGATLYIVGDFDPEAVKTLVGQYFASLPKGKKAPSVNQANLSTFNKNDVTDVFKTKMNTPKASVAHVYSKDLPYSVDLEANLDAAGFILDMIYTETLREEEGGTYGASAILMAGYQPDRAVAQVVFDTNTAQQEKLRSLAVSGLRSLAEQGPTAEQVLRAVENAKKNLPEKRITNRYWLKAFQHNTYLGGNFDAEYEAAIAKLSADSIKAAVKSLLDGACFYETVMLPE